MPLAIDLYAGLGGWSDGLLAEGWNVVRFDIERHAYGEHRYPAQLVIQDVLTLHGSQFRGADLIVASPPCGRWWRAYSRARAGAQHPAQARGRAPQGHVAGRRAARQESGGGVTEQLPEPSVPVVDA